MSHPQSIRRIWQIDGTNNDDGMVNLGDPEWEDLDHSNAGGEYEAFHDLSEEMYTVTGRYTSSYGLQCSSLPLGLMADVVLTIVHGMTTCNNSMQHGRINIFPLSWHICTGTVTVCHLMQLGQVTMWSPFYV